MMISAIKTLINEIDNYPKISRNDLMQQFINEKLEELLLTYQHDIEKRFKNIAIYIASYESNAKVVYSRLLRKSKINSGSELK